MSAFRRILRISLVSVAEGAILGAGEGLVFSPDPVTTMVGFHIGAFIGAILAPYSVWMLWNTRLERAVAGRLLIGIAAVVVLSLICSNPVIPMISVVIIYLITTAVLSLVAEDYGPIPGHCAACGYNLTGNVSGICPECGSPVEPRRDTT